MKMNTLTERQKLILALIIRGYIEKAQPVGSRRLVEDYGLTVSSATVRNDMLALTEMGYLRQPHTSAGRVPTEKGYRFFVRQLMGHAELPSETKRTIVHQFYQAGFDVERWMRILVLSGGEVSQQMLTLAEPVNQERLSVVAQAFNDSLAGMDVDGIATQPSQKDALEQDIIKLVLDDMKRATDVVTGEVYRDGFTHVLAEPEFGEAEVAQNALRILEEQPLLDDLLSRTVLSNDIGGVQVLIGGEGTWEELRDFSMVLSRYGSPGLATGTLGVLGPIRMPYGRTISTVRFVSSLLSDLVEEMITG
jgi:heat-inducible transcriptional repressor